MAPSCYWRHAARQRQPQLRCKRAQSDEQLIPDIQRVWHANWQVYGADKVWTQMNREGIAVARCTVERLMKRLGLEGARRGQHKRTTFADPGAVDVADNGGATLTLLPGVASGVMGVGQGCLAVDQRGETRPTDGCAAGAVEPQ